MILGFTLGDQKRRGVAPSDTEHRARVTSSTSDRVTPRKSDTEHRERYGEKIGDVPDRMHGCAPRCFRPDFTTQNAAEREPNLPSSGVWRFGVLAVNSLFSRAAARRRMSEDNALLVAFRGKNNALQRGALLDRERPLCNPPQRVVARWGHGECVGALGFGGDAIGER